jgi:hypothetical protein
MAPKIDPKLLALLGLTASAGCGMFGPCLSIRMETGDTGEEEEAEEEEEEEEAEEESSESRIDRPATGSTGDIEVLRERTIGQLQRDGVLPPGPSDPPTDPPP